MTHIQHHPETHQPITANHGSNIFKVDLGEQATKAVSWVVPAMLVLGVFSGFSVAMSILTFYYFHDQMYLVHNSAEQMRIQVLSQNAILQREGMIRPGDEWMGPEGNLQFDPKLINRSK